jgi:gliding motility-associated-like protein
VSLAVTSDKGCKDTVDQVVYVNPRPTVTFSGDSLSGCNPVKTNFTDSCSVAAPDYITTWYWDLGNGTTLMDTSGAPVSTTYTNGTNTYNVSYNVSLTAISEVGCASKMTKNGYVTVYPIPKALFWWDPGDASVLAPGIQFHDQSLGATTYTWNFGDVFNPSNNSSTVANPYHEYSDQQPYTYYVTQYVMNNYGCKDSIREPVIIKPEVTFYVPNAFTPNYNGLNDGFKGTGIGIDNSTYNMWIFDRWGNEVFHSTDLDTAWDGKKQGKGDICQEDTYVWKVYFRDIEAKEYSYKGVVHLLK